MAHEAKKENVDWRAAQMSPQAQAHLQDFLARYGARVREVEQMPLIVLVWGPGEKGGDLYEKRLQIRDFLRQCGDAAVFSEEIDAACAPLNLSSRAREFLQAKEADFIIVLYGSPGAVAETHDLGPFLEELGRKILIFIDGQHVHGYMATDTRDSSASCAIATIMFMSLNILRPFRNAIC
jgi:hypothetical protein